MRPSAVAVSGQSAAQALDGAIIHYRSRRQWPGPTPAVANISVEVRERLPTRDLDQFDHYLTARWLLYTTFGPVQLKVEAEGCAATA